MKPSREMFDEARALHLERVDAYRRGEIDEAPFRPIRLSYGLYYQLDHTSYMQRIKLPGGLMTAEQMDVLAEVSDDYGRGIAHATTRQDIQIHWLPIEQVGELYERLERVGVTTRGACADSVRNVTACPYAGVAVDEPFDITPYVLAIHDYFLFNPLNLTLPRKFKIAVESCPLDCAQASINDIGLYARMSAGRPGFSVWVGGGLGAAPHLATRVADFVPADDVLAVCEAIVRLQHRSGERRNRHKARLKFLARKLGPERLRLMVDEEEARVLRELGDELRAEVREAVAAYRVPAPADGDDGGEAAEPGFEEWARTNAVAQRQAGYFAATVAVPLGDLSGDQLRGLARLSRELGNGTARLTNEQNVVLPWIRHSRLPRLHAGLRGLELAEPRASRLTDVVSCPGLDFCSLAVTRSMGVADRIRRHLEEVELDAEELGLFRVKISGCPNSCGQHHIGDIGLTGAMVKGPDGTERPHYSILVGGGVGEGRTRIGKRLFGRYPEAEAPRAVVALARFYRERRQAGERVGEFLDRVGQDALDEVARTAVGAPPG